MDFCNLSKVSDLEYFGNLVYSVLMVEYFILAVVLGCLLKKSYKDFLLDIREFQVYLALVIVSSVLKVMMFFNYCEFNNQGC